jgi:hypothetical protein
MNGSPPCDSVRLMLQQLLPFATLILRGWRLSSSACIILLREGDKYVDVRRSFLEATTVKLGIEPGRA